MFCFVLYCFVFFEFYFDMLFCTHTGRWQQNRKRNTPGLRQPNLQVRPQPQHVIYIRTLYPAPRFQLLKLVLALLLLLYVLQMHRYSWRQWCVLSAHSCIYSYVLVSNTSAPVLAQQLQEQLQQALVGWLGGWVILLAGLRVQYAHTHSLAIAASKEKITSLWNSWRGISRNPRLGLEFW